MSQQRQLRAMSQDIRSRQAESEQLQKQHKDLTRYAELREGELDRVRTLNSTHDSDLRDAHGTIARLRATIDTLNVQLETLSTAALQAELSRDAQGGSGGGGSGAVTVCARVVCLPRSRRAISAPKHRGDGMSCSAQRHSIEAPLAAQLSRSKSRTQSGSQLLAHAVAESRGG